ncbi:CoA ester lyase [Pseudonocardia kujensis]|uniref:HpcH/HpaI aldolase/citrate lyase family protein n=1 Tax=Pseudonocardia kujensis TaxID=1128675 RepID=UPI001E458798|nr:CoA ester lyase [Pseudonocardia kujensis]MCE0766030.1 CoA ester lyase [Pseudonocardia kujensis]
MTWGGVAPLFVPAHVGRLRDKAAALEVSIILDLEDAVPAAEKHAARRGAAELIERLPGRCSVRINPLAVARDFGVAEGGEDLLAVLRPGIAGIVAPKIDDADALRTVDERLTEAERRAGVAAGATPLGVVIETARGVVGMDAIARAGAAATRRVELSFGAGDLTTDLGIEWGADESVFDTPRALLPVACRAAGLGRPRDTVFADVGDVEGLRASAARGKALGYAGKAAIHPAQIPIIREVYRPTPRQLDWAREVVDAAARHAADGAGAFLLDGRMIDDPVVARARDLLTSATTEGHD